jgi:glycosyltransferase involved in cell wall biosynthesis
VFGPLVSIVTPTFNHQLFIERCVRSVLRQSYPFWELIVIDDASRDDTAQIVERFTAEDHRIRLIRHRSNYGAGRLPETYNEAVGHCRGELIAVLEGDDEWAPEKLARQVPVFDDERVVLCYSDYDEVTTEGLLITRHGVSAAAGVTRSGLLQNLRFFSALKSFGANTVMLRRDVLLAIGGFVDAGLPLVDYPTWLRLASRGDYVRRERAHLLASGLTDPDLEQLVRNGARALTEKQRSRRYFEGKYHLLTGHRLKAIGRFGGALVAPDTRLRHRMGALAGLIAAATSPRLILSLSRMAKHPLSDR